MHISLPSGLMLDTGNHSDISCLEMCLQQILFVFLKDYLAAYTSAHLLGWHQACLQGDLPVSLPIERCQPILGSRHNTSPALTWVQSRAESETLILCFIKFVGACVALTTWAAEEENCQHCKLPSTLVTCEARGMLGRSVTHRSTGILIALQSQDHHKQKDNNSKTKNTSPRHKKVKQRKTLSSTLL